MLRPRRDAQLPLRRRSGSPPRLSQKNKQLKRRRIDPDSVDRNNLDQALAVIAAAPEDTDELPILISTELPYFKANYIQNRPGCSRYTGISELGFFGFFFSDSVVEIFFKETNLYAEFYLQTLSLFFFETRYWVPITPAEIRIYLSVYIYFSLYLLIV
jgi:hypothetical protein